MGTNSDIKVIVVDDETSVLEIIQRYLTKKGWDVRGAKNADQAMSFLDEEPPDLWLIDIKMPGGNGFELAKKIRARNESSVILLMTGYPDNNSMKDMDQLDIMKILEKPIDPTFIHQILSNAKAN